MLLLWFTDQWHVRTFNYTSEWNFLTIRNCNIAQILTKKKHCTIVPLIKLSMAKVLLRRIEDKWYQHEQKMHKKLNMIFSSFNTTLPSFKYCIISMTINHLIFLKFNSCRSYQTNEHIFISQRQANNRRIFRLPDK